VAEISRDAGDDKARRRTSAKRQTQVVDDAIYPRRAPRRWSQYVVGEALSEDLAPAQDCIAAKAAGNHHELNDTSRQRQIGHAAAVMTVHASGNRFA